MCIASVDMISEQYLGGSNLDLINRIKSELIEAKSVQYINLLHGIEMEKSLKQNKEKYLQLRKNQVEDYLKNIKGKNDNCKIVELKILTFET